MDYQKVYDAIVLRFARTPPLLGEERDVHHIVPRCMGGEDADYNLVALPPRYHFVAHLCLAKIHGGKLAHAAYRMSNMGRYGSRKFAWLRRKNVEALKGNKFSLGVRASPETRAKLSLARLGNKNAAGNKGRPASNKGKKHSPETIQKMRLAHMGNKPSVKALAALAERNSGNTFGKAKAGKKSGPHSVKRTPEHCERLSRAARARWAARKALLQT